MNSSPYTTAVNTAEESNNISFRYRIRETVLRRATRFPVATEQRAMLLLRERQYPIITAHHRSSPRTVTRSSAFTELY
jgi:hypothetical protein